MIQTKQYYSHGKLLLTGEYLVLDGATALAVPTKKGQSLTVTPNILKGASDVHTFYWKSYALDGSCWFACSFELITSGFEHAKPDPVLKNYFDPKIANTLLKILNTAQKLNPAFLKESQGSTVETHLEFDRNWGLGSSSTLINNIAQWVDVDAFELLQKSFGGSGYDIACAQEDLPVLYTRTTPKPTIKTVAFDPPFKDQLFFVYRNQKQDSKASIAHYRSQKQHAITELKAQINKITDALLESTSLSTFEQLIERHELLLSNILKTPAIKSQLFPDYPGAIKSLGGWGGDFILATGDLTQQEYFRIKGFDVIVPYVEMVL